MLLELYGLCTLDRYDFTGNTDLPNAGDFELFCENDLGICNENINQDSVLLTAFFFRTNGTSWTNTWDLELPMSTWNGVTLNADGRVVEINLRDNNLTGTIPSHIYQLENLKVLDLGENRINGWQTTSFFPDNIEVLRLDNNNLHSNLSFLPKITNDAQLRVLDLSDNHFYGCFSDRLSTLCQNNISYNFANNDLITSLEAYCTHSASACFETHHDCPKFTTVVTDATENTADGAIRLVQLNETTPVEYSWNTGANTQNLLNIPVGNYQVTLTSESDCSVDAKYNKLYRYSKTKVLPLEDAVVSVDSMLIENEEEVILSELSQIQSICLNIEHSYMRDLEISLTCPNGQSMILHEYSGRFNSFPILLGEPIEEEEDNINLVPVIGYNYCWTADTSLLTWVESMENFSFGDTLPSGDYAPYDDFSNLIGCPINGTWELKIEDLWWQDNGSITDWTLQFYDQNAQKDIVVGIRPENVINGRSSNMTAFEIHPNPSKGSFSLQTDLAEMAVLRIFNAQGQLLNEQIVPKGKQQIQQDYDLVDGLYYFVLQSNLQTWRKKVVIEK